jgi:hypothetical protein
MTLRKTPTDKLVTEARGLLAKYATTGASKADHRRYEAIYDELDRRKDNPLLTKWTRDEAAKYLRKFVEMVPS